MKKILVAMLFALMTVGGAHAYQDMDSYDTANPLFFERAGDILSVTGIDYGNEIMAIHQKLSVGINGKLSINGEVNWQHDFHGPQDGFSYSGVGIAYRFSDSGIIADFMADIKFGGRAKVPEYADTVYSVGVRAGKKWNRITLAGTLETHWIFDDTYGMAYIDLTPEIYIRAWRDWFVGADVKIRKATKPSYDAEWIGAKIVKQYGRTMYTGFGQYEFEAEEFRAGLRVNILF